MRTGLKTYFRAAGAAIGCFALGAQLYIVLRNAGAQGLSYGAEVIRFLSYMTIWMNILATMVFGWPLLFPRSKLAAFLERPLIQTGTVLYVFVVGTVYHFLLADIWEPAGLQYLADVLLHYVMPLLYLVYWAAFAPKGHQRFRSSVLWLLFPLIYTLYALTRGAVTQFYPYPFIDVTQLGYVVTLRNILLLALAYWLLGMLLVAIDSCFRKSPGAGRRNGMRDMARL